MSKNKIKLSKTAYKGTSDTYPEQMSLRNYLFDIWREVAKSFGYEEYDTPLIEEASLYKAKSGDELADNQLYSFTDKGGREIAIRPEMTPSLARIVASKRKELLFPLRWFNIGRYYRYEKPQRGRTREFFQLNIDILGVDDITAELEIIQFIIAVMQRLNAPKATYELKVSNRYLLDYLFDEILKIDDKLRVDVTKAIDNYTKIKPEEFESYLLELGLDKKQASSLNDFLKWDINQLEKLRGITRGADELLNLFEKIEALGIENVKFRPYIVRGLAYYTGTVFEMFDIGSQENPRALFGGGRYDNLLEIFDEESIGACGLGWGDVTTLDYLNTYNLLPEPTAKAEVFVTLMEESLLEKSCEIAQYLRAQGIQTEMQLTPIKLAKQLKYVNRKKIPWGVIIGQDEIKNEKIVLKNMETAKQLSLDLKEVLKEIR